MIQQSTYSSDQAARSAALGTVLITLLLVAAGAFSSIGLSFPSAQAQVIATPNPIIIIASPTPMPFDLAVPAPAPHLVAVYAAPDGVAFPQPINLSAESVALVGRHGNEWTQIQRVDGSRVWLRSADLPLEQQALAAMQPEAVPEAPVVMSAPVVPAAPQWQSQPAPLAQAPVIVVETPPTPEPQRVLPIDPVLNDPSQNGGNVAPIGCPFPILNGVCANGVLARDVPDQYAADDLQKQQNYLDSERHSAVPTPAPGQGDVPTGGGK